jgi:hypothetical protein
VITTQSFAGKKGIILNPVRFLYQQLYCPNVHLSVGCPRQPNTIVVGFRLVNSQ